MISIHLKVNGILMKDNLKREEKQRPRDDEDLQLPKLQEICALLDTFNKSTYVQKLREFYAQKSLAEIYGIARSELPHSSFVAWLLNPKGSHGLGAFPLTQLIRSIFPKRGVQQEKEIEYMVKFRTCDLDFSECIVRTEYDLGPSGSGSKRDGRLDILIEGIQLDGKPYRIIIENKVGSKENKGKNDISQTNKYWKHFEDLKANDQILNIYLFLLPLANSELDNITKSDREEICQCEEFTVFNYQDIVDYILGPALEMSISDIAKGKIRDYLSTLSYPSFLMEVNKRNGSKKVQGVLVMAYTKEEQELLDKFWSENKDLLTAALLAQASITRDDNLKEQLEAVAKETKNSTRYDIIIPDPEISESVEVCFQENVSKGNVTRGYSNGQNLPCRIALYYLVISIIKCKKFTSKDDIKKSVLNKIHFNNKGTINAEKLADKDRSFRLKFRADSEDIVWISNQITHSVMDKMIDNIKTILKGSHYTLMKAADTNTDKETLTITKNDNIPN